MQARLTAHAAMRSVSCHIYLTLREISWILFMSDIFDIYHCFAEEKSVIQKRNERMRAARKEAGLSQAELAKDVGATRQTICSIEASNYNPSLNLCKLICKKLGKTLDELFWD
ncbi:helix-turn-helix transcriptional regulator [Mobiluncus curtisii]|nr:helix-turn-helix transcriptional regulator [Mobiluncus curtisii]NMW46979.1 helix-turn-helix transcriptional regulator [Mobiluncus curtisii]NMW88472.1 helix-turn-helix transcriptional regulator [Mobiluncus curtisii]